MAPEKGRRTPNGAPTRTLRTIADQDDRGQRRTPRLVEDAAKLLTEAGRFLDAAESALAHAIADGDRDEPIDAAAHAIRCCRRVARFVSTATTFDVDEAA